MTREEEWIRTKDYLYDVLSGEEADEIIKALEQEPKTVLYSGDGYADGHMVYDMAECPSCGYKYEDDDKDWKEPFCPHCGQPLKWESEANMTKEEIIGGLQFTIDMLLLNPNTGENREEYELNDMDKTTIDACKGAIELLDQEPKTGHWDKGYTFFDGEYWKCSKCNELIKVKYPMNYCNNCGSKNREG